MRPRTSQEELGLQKNRSTRVFSWWSSLMCLRGFPKARCILLDLLDIYQLASLTSLVLFFSLLYDFQTLLSSQNLSSSHILYLKLIKVELLWMKGVWAWLLPPRPLLILTSGPASPPQNPSDFLECILKTSAMPSALAFSSFTFPHDLI